MRRDKERPPRRRAGARPPSVARQVADVLEQRAPHAARSTEDEGFIAHEDVIELLEAIERWQRNIARAREVFEGWLVSSPSMRKDWAKFIKAGGVTAHDFRRFLEGRFRYRRTRQRGHLRLIASNSAKRRVLHRSGGDEVA